MKKRMITLLVLVSAGTVLFAGNRNFGNNKNFENNRDERNFDRGERMEEFLEDQTITTIDGTLKLVNDEPAVLVSGKTSYTIMAPYNQLIDLNVKDGMKVTVEGVEWNAPMNWDGSEKTLILTKITINGKTTTIDHGEGYGMMGFGFGGRGRGSSNGYGRGYCFNN